MFPDKSGKNHEEKGAVTAEAFFFFEDEAFEALAGAWLVGQRFAVKGLKITEE